MVVCSLEEAASQGEATSGSFTFQCRGIIIVCGWVRSMGEGVEGKRWVCVERGEW